MGAGKVEVGDPISGAVEAGAGVVGSLIGLFDDSDERAARAAANARVKAARAARDAARHQAEAQRDIVRMQQEGAIAGAVEMRKTLVMLVIAGGALMVLVYGGRLLTS